MMIVPFTVLPFKASHAMSIPDIEANGKGRELLRNEQYFEAIEKLGPGFTLFVKNEIVGSVVFINLWWDGLAEIVMFISRSQVQKYGILASRLCRKNIVELQRQNKWRRVQAKVAASSERDIRWAKAMGFEIESTKRCYGPDGEDYLEM